MGIQIDYTISLGTVVEVGSIIIGGAIALGVFKQAVNDMREKIDEIEGEVKEFGKALIQLAVQDKRLDRIEEDYRDLRRGRGFIRDSGNDD